LTRPVTTSLLSACSVTARNNMRSAMFAFFWATLLSEPKTLARLTGFFSVVSIQDQLLQHYENMP